MAGTSPAMTIEGQADATSANGMRLKIRAAPRRRQNHPSSASRSAGEILDAVEFAEERAGAAPYDLDADLDGNEGRKPHQRSGAAVAKDEMNQGGTCERHCKMGLVERLFSDEGGERCGCGTRWRS
jgi:hypothetical protein